MAHPLALVDRNNVGEDHDQQQEQEEEEGVGDSQQGVDEEQVEGGVMEGEEELSIQPIGDAEAEEAIKTDLHGYLTSCMAPLIEDTVAVIFNFRSSIAELGESIEHQRASTKRKREQLSHTLGQTWKMIQPVQAVAMNMRAVNQLAAGDAALDGGDARHEHAPTATVGASANNEGDVPGHGSRPLGRFSSVPAAAAASARLHRPGWGKMSLQQPHNGSSDDLGDEDAGAGAGGMEHAGEGLVQPEDSYYAGEPEDDTQETQTANQLYDR